MQMASQTRMDRCDSEPGDAEEEDAKQRKQLPCRKSIEPIH
jgi:hypothetical protein